MMYLSGSKRCLQVRYVLLFQKKKYNLFFKVAHMWKIKGWKEFRGKDDLRIMCANKRTETTLKNAHR